MGINVLQEKKRNTISRLCAKVYGHKYVNSWYILEENRVIFKLRDKIWGIYYNSNT